MADEEVTEHALRCLEHLRQARTLGTSIAAYARTHGLKVRMLYDAEQQLRKKGLIADRVPSPPRPKPRAEEKPERSESGFVSVCLEPPRAGSCASVPVLRVQHVRGHVLEFGSWPPAEVIAAILSGGCDVAA